MVQATNLSQNDIDTARQLAHWANQYATDNVQRVDERLFRTEDGRYFLHAAKGAGFVVDRDHTLSLLGDDDARKWAVAKCDASTYRKIFKASPPA